MWFGIGNENMKVVINALPGPSSGSVTLVVALGHDLGDEVQILVLVVPRGGCSGRPVRGGGHVPGS